MSQNNIGQVYFARFKVFDANEKLIESHPFVCIDIYTSNYELKTYMLCQSNDNDEKNKYRYTLKVDNEKMGTPRFRNETVVNCNVRYVVNKELLSKANLKYAKLGKITSKDIKSIDNLWKEAYQRDEHAFLHIIDISVKQGELIYDVVDDKGQNFKHPIKSSKQIKKEQEIKTEGMSM